MAKRKLILIDEKKCNGCGLCLPGCSEGALQVVDGKVRLVKESYCDGLGACLKHCPQGALRVEEKDAEEYDALGVLAHLEEKSPVLAKKHLEHMRAHGLDIPNKEQAGPRVGCPSQQWFQLGAQGSCHQTGLPEVASNFSTLSQWPVKLRLIPPVDGFFKKADLVFVSDCVPFAHGNLHNDFIKDRVIASCCPKFEDAAANVEKIKNILESANLSSITVLYMEAPCCSGLVQIVREALEKAGVDIPLELVQIGVRGGIIQREKS